MEAMIGWREGNSLGRAPLGRSEMEATAGWTEGKPWEIGCVKMYKRHHAQSTFGS